MSEILTAVLHELALEIRTQDNASTAHPIFVVQSRHRIYGMDPSWGGDVVWLRQDETVEADAEESIELSERQEREGEVDDWDLVGYIDTWINVQPFFSRAGAEEYIFRNAHRLTDPRVYVESAYRNPEWQAVREFLLRVANEDSPEDLRALEIPT